MRAFRMDRLILRCQSICRIWEQWKSETRRWVRKKLISLLVLLKSISSPLKMIQIKKLINWGNSKTKSNKLMSTWTNCSKTCSSCPRITSTRTTHTWPLTISSKPFKVIVKTTTMRLNNRLWLLLRHLLERRSKYRTLNRLSSCILTRGRPRRLLRSTKYTYTPKRNNIMVWVVRYLPT